MAEKTVPTAASQEAAGREPTRAEESYVRPPVDIYEDEQGLVVVADLPGVEPGALDIRVDRGQLTIQGRATHLASGQPAEREFALTGFFRQFQLPEEIDSGRIAADFKHGVLTLRLPREERTQPRRIEVRVG
jgi:HSP20 family protein